MASNTLSAEQWEKLGCTALRDRKGEQRGTHRRPLSRTVGGAGTAEAQWEDATEARGLGSWNGAGPSEHRLGETLQSSCISALPTQPPLPAVTEETYHTPGCVRATELQAVMSMLGTAHTPGMPQTPVSIPSSK